MRLCPSCGRPTEADARFCHHCGAQLRRFDEILRAERIAWIVGSFANSALVVLMCIQLVRIYATDLLAEFTQIGHVSAFLYGVILPGQILSTLFTVVSVIFGFVSAARIKRLLREKDTGSILRRGSRIPMIVFAFLLNQVAAIFYLVNFVRIKAEKTHVNLY